jgi:hypothetical protein
MPVPPYDGRVKNVRRRRRRKRRKKWERQEEVNARVSKALIGTRMQPAEALFRLEDMQTSGYQSIEGLAKAFRRNKV